MQGASPMKGENVTKRLRRTLIIVFSLMVMLCGSVSVYGLSAKAELVAPSKEEAKTLFSVYEDGLGTGMTLVWGSENTDLEYTDSSDDENDGKNIAVDCTKVANTEFYIDFGKQYDIYSGKGFSGETYEDFYKKSAIEFWIKLNDVPGSFFNIYLF